MLDVGKMVDAVLDAIDKPLRAFHERLKTVEARDPERGERGEAGPPGAPGPIGDKGDAGRDGRDAADLALLQNHIDARIADGIAEVFKVATITTPDDGRTLHVKLGDAMHEIKTAIPLDAGVWTERAYAAGDGVTHGGSFFIAKSDTGAKPGKSDEWRLAVKRGNDGRDYRADDKHVAQPLRFK